MLTAAILHQLDNKGDVRIAVEVESSVEVISIVETKNVYSGAIVEPVELRERQASPHSAMQPNGSCVAAVGMD